MPIYEYTCGKCGAKFELLVRGGTKAACPTCRSRRLKKEWSAFGASTGGSAKSGAAPSGGG